MMDWIMRPRRATSRVAGNLLGPGKSLPGVSSHAPREKNVPASIETSGKACTIELIKDPNLQNRVQYKQNLWLLPLVMLSKMDT